LSAFQTAISYRFVLWLKATRPGKRITIKDLPAQLVELSEKDLQQIVGGAFGGIGSYEDK
jgi:bacteriocin-like protein